jgi:hypothetical protein
LPITHQIFFTRNGYRLRAAISLEQAGEEDLVPLVSLQSHCEVLEANMGPTFLYVGPEVHQEAAAVGASAALMGQTSEQLLSIPPTRSRAAQRVQGERPLALRLPSPLPSNPSMLFSPFSPTRVETPKSSLWRQQSALSPRLLERGAFELVPDDDDFASKEDGHDFAYALTGETHIPPA